MYKLLSHLTKDNKLIRFSFTNLRTLSNTATATVKNEQDEDKFGMANKFAEHDTVKNKARLKNLFKPSTNNDFIKKKTRYNNNNMQKYEKKKKYIYNDNNYNKRDAQTSPQDTDKANLNDDSDTFGTLSEDHKEM